MTSLHRFPAARVIAAFNGAALLAVSVAPKAAAQSGLPRFERSDCLVNGDWARTVTRDCGWLVVPESRDRPNGSTVRLAVEVFRAKEPDGTPPRVILHGGPGGNGGIRRYSPGVARSGLTLHRDVVLYDQRSAGLSQPKLCLAYDKVAEVAYTLPEGAQRDERLNEARRACLAELDAKGIDRLAYDTAANTADLIDLRHALGYTSWDIYGPSYGARLAQEAMVRDGQAIRSVMLVSPVGRGILHQAEQPLSTQRAFERAFGACRQQPSCRKAFPKLEQDFYAALTALAKSPLAVSIARPDGGTDTAWLDGDGLLARLREGLKSREGLARIPLLVHEVRAGDRLRAAREILGEGSPPEFLADRALRQLILCHDNYGPAFRRTLDSVNRRVRPPFRRTGDRECEEWLPRLAGAELRPPVRSDIPTLILSGHFDDRTPTEQARRIASTLGRAWLVELPDKGHDPLPGACHSAIVNKFFEDPTRRPDTSCLAAIPPIPFATTWDPPDGGVKGQVSPRQDDVVFFTRTTTAR
jgi:pimeloyl-ACP methyl ester carboxylesterase